MRIEALSLRSDEAQHSCRMLELHVDMEKLTCSSRCRDYLRCWRRRPR